MTEHERTLSPNIVLSPDGDPIILGTAIPTRDIYRAWQRHPTGDNKTMDAIADDTGACTWEVHEAIGFEAGRRYAKEQRKAKRHRRKEGAQNGVRTPNASLPDLVRMYGRYRAALSFESRGGLEPRPAMEAECRRAWEAMFPGGDEDDWS